MKQKLLCLCIEDVVFLEIIIDNAILMT